MGIWCYNVFVVVGIFVFSRFWDICDSRERVSRSVRIVLRWVYDSGFVISFNNGDGLCKSRVIGDCGDREWLGGSIGIWYFSCEIDNGGFVIVIDDSDISDYFRVICIWFSWIRDIGVGCGGRR